MQTPAAGQMRLDLGSSTWSHLAERIVDLDLLGRLLVHVCLSVCVRSKFASLQKVPDGG